MSLEQIIMKEAFKEAKKLSNDLYMVKDGSRSTANGFLMVKKMSFMMLPSLELIILDLNMPRKNGLEVLAEIRCNLKWKHIPVLVFSNSEFHNGDICNCYAMGVNAYLTKPH